MELPEGLSDIKQEKQGEGHSEAIPDKKCWECGGGIPLPYWCETCQRMVPEKRCPNCGLKARKIRSAAGDGIDNSAP